jgi:hypothetical protein
VVWAFLAALGVVLALQPAPARAAPGGPRADREAGIRQATAGGGPGVVYDLYDSYPNLRRLRGYFLRGTNRYHAPNPSTTSDRTSLWFQPQPGGAFKQFATAPYGECHWDLLRWAAGSTGLLVYLATEADCYSAHTGIVFTPGIAYMPKTWTPGRPWRDAGVSQTVYSESGVPVCEGANTWHSVVRGLVRMPDGIEAVHTQTNETQSLLPIPGAPGSTVCPPGRTTRFGWQENYYLATPIAVRAADGAVTGSDLALARSVGGNPAATRAVGHPQWDSVFTKWLQLPPRDVGTLSTTATGVANGSPGNTIGFTYAAPAAGLANGVLRIRVPPGWTPPAAGGGPGCTTASAGVVGTSGQLIVVSGLSLPAGGQAVIRYGATAGGPCAAGDGATASTVPGAPAWRAELRTDPREPFTAFPSSPSVDVTAADGAGTLTVATPSLAASVDGTVRLVFTASTGGVSDGTLAITVPAGWTAPVSVNAPGCTTTSAGAVTTSGQSIVVSDLTLAANTSVVVDYGATAGGSCASGDGASAPAAPGTSVFAAEAMSSAAGTLTPLGASPAVTIT